MKICENFIPQKFHALQYIALCAVYTSGEAQSVATGEGVEALYQSAQSVLFYCS